MMVLSSCAEDAVFRGDEARLVQSPERVIHQDHALGLPCLDAAGNHECLAFADAVGDSRRIDQHFNGQSAAVAVRSGNKLLGDDAAQGFADHDADLVALFHREDVQHTVHRTGCGARMQGAEHKVAGFSRRERQGDCLQVAHFTNHDDVRVFTEGSAQGPRRRIPCACALHAG